MISESLLRRSTVSDGRLLRDSVICGFCVHMNARRRTFRVATSVAGKKFRMSGEEAQALAMEVLRECRAGRQPSKLTPAALPLPTLREALTA